MTAQRPKVPNGTQTEVLTACRRRCCLCYYVDRVTTERKGQIAHLDQNRANNEIGNLVFLCLDHHDAYDGKTSQSKGYTEHEVRNYRDRLVADMARPATSIGTYTETEVREPMPNAPSATVQAADRILWLTVTNRAKAERFTVRVWGFEQRNKMLTVPWTSGEREKMLRRGEWSHLRIMEVEPALLRPVNGLVSIVDKAVWEWAQPEVDERNKQGTRLVRFFGAPDWTSNADIVVPVNRPFWFTLQVISHEQESVTQTHSYVVTEHTRLLTPYDEAALVRANQEDAEAIARTIAELQKLLREGEGRDEQNNQ